VEQELQEAGVRGINVSKVKGYGEYHNFFAADGMVDSVRLEIFTCEDRVDAILAAILAAGHTGSPGDGIVVVYPIERFVNIRLRSNATPDNT
jgi:nitrogen regulatory protein P-II 1